MLRRLALCALASFWVTAGAAERVERGALASERVPIASPALRARLAQYLGERSSALGGWSADNNGLFVITGYDETPQVFFVDQPGRAPLQITHFDESVESVAPSPADPNLFIFEQDRGGDENYQLFLFDRASNESKKLSEGGVRNGSAVWSKDGQRIAWYATRAGNRRAIVMTSLAARDERRTVFEAAGAWRPLAYSPDGERLLLFHFRSINESELFLLDLASGDAREVNPSTKAIAYGQADFAPDGRAIYFTSDEDGEFQHLYRYNLRTGEKTDLTKDAHWNVEIFALSPKRNRLAYALNVNGRSVLRLLDLRHRRSLPAPALAPGIVHQMAFRRDGRELAIAIDSNRGPSEVYSWLPLRRRGIVKRWTTSAVGPLSAEGLTAPQFVSYPTFDNVDGAPRQIPALYYKPQGEGRRPVVISIHGGPEEQARPEYSSMIRFWLNEIGAAVIQPNIRGSAGYGKSYLKLDNGRKRVDAIKDIGALLDWIAADPNLDERRVMLYGASYGGFMVLASLARYNERLAGGVDIVGISDFVAFLENTASYRRDQRRAEYGDERDPDMRVFLQSISPINHAEAITKPVLIVQGLNDPRVPTVQSESILAAIKANGGKPWYLLAKDEGHAIRKRSNRNALMEAIALFTAHVFDYDLSAASNGQ